MKLGQYLERIGKSGRQAAKELEVSPAAVCRWINGKCIPSPEEMRKIMRWSGGKVMANDFYSEGGQP